MILLPPSLPLRFTDNLLVNSLLALGFSILVVFSVTYLLTTIRFHLSPVPKAHNGSKIAPSPPTVPYHLPYLGSALSMATNAHNFYQYLNGLCRSTHHTVLGVRTGPLFMYFITGSSNILTMFKNSRTMSTEEIFTDVNKFAFGLGKKDVKILLNDESGPFAKPSELPSHGGIGRKGAPRIWRALHEAHLNVQTGKALRALSEIFMKQFTWVLDHYERDELQAGEGKDDWETVSLYYGFFRNKMSLASMRALVGTEIFRYEPNVVADFWEFFEGFLPLFFGMPRLLYPKVYAARARLHAGFTKLLKVTQEDYEEIRQKDDVWSAELGGGINRLRDEAYMDAGLSLEGRAQLMAGFLMGILGNAVPVAGWILLELVQRPSLLEALRQEALTTIVESSDSVESTAFASFDLSKLSNLPLFSSVYSETLRLYMSTVPFRKLLTPLEIGGYMLDAGKTVLTPTTLAHSDPAFWTQSGHPPEEFWPERFVGQNDKSLAGHFLPFGGGTTICPGRFFARQEIISAVAMMITRYEVEMVGFVGKDGKIRAEKPTPDVGTGGAGAMTPTGDCLVRMRRRRL